VDQYRDTVAILDTDGQEVGRAHALLQKRVNYLRLPTGERLEGHTEWNGTMQPLPDEPSPAWNVGEYVLRLANGREGRVLIQNIRIRGTSFGSSEQAVVLGNDTPPF
jgi:hypothetical protein